MVGVVVVMVSAYLLMGTGGVGTREGEGGHTHSANSTHGYWYGHHLFLDGLELFRDLVEARHCLCDAFRAGEKTLTLTVVFAMNILTSSCSYGSLEQ